MARWLIAPEVLTLFISVGFSLRKEILCLSLFRFAVSRSPACELLSPSAKRAAGARGGRNSSACARSGCRFRGGVLRHTPYGCFVLCAIFSISYKKMCFFLEKGLTNFHFYVILVLLDYGGVFCGGKIWYFDEI